MTSEVLRVANCSGFYGDRFSAAREMVEGGPIDVLTGDYLAELTLLILEKDRRRDPSLGWARTFPRQLEEIAATCLDRGIRIVVNAGGLNPAGCADACRAVYARLGLAARVAHVEGDDLRDLLPDLMAAGESFPHLDLGTPLADLGAPLLGANAYLGGWGIAAALEAGADLVICPRVTDAALVLGPAAWRFGWARDDWDRLAGALAAGHVLECGAQATGGNYAFFREVEGLGAPGFPVAEIEADGSFTVTKHPGTGGEVSVGTVTAQLLYEISGARYESPDVTLRVESIELAEVGPDRVRATGVRGAPPPSTTKVCLTHEGGFRNRVIFLLTGLEIEAKARLAEGMLWRALGGRDQFEASRVELHGTTRSDPATAEVAVALLTVSVRDPDPNTVGRRFSNAAVEMALASYPGLTLTDPPGPARSFGVLWPALVASERVPHRVVFEGRSIEVGPSQREDEEAPPPGPAPSRASTQVDDGPTRRVPLGTLVGARSGDKGGHATLGVWARTDAASRWLATFLTVDRLRELLPEARNLEIVRSELPNLRALVFVLHRFLGDGVGGCLAVDAQAKGLGEYLRAKEVPIPASLLPPA